MDCEQARQLFDAYLDGELSASLATEFGAHRVRCPECRRELALLEVTGHIITSDDDPVVVREGFPERLLACMDAPRGGWRRHVRRAVYIAGPLAAAAVIGLAFVGVFDSPPSRVAGEKEDYDAGGMVEVAAPDFDSLAESPATDGQDEADRELELWIEQTRENWAKKAQSGESLQNALDMTILQLLDVLDDAKDESLDADHFPGADVPAPGSLEPVSHDGDEVEDPQ